MALPEIDLTPPPWANYLAQDADGTWHWFKEFPDHCEGYFYEDPGHQKPLEAGKTPIFFEVVSNGYKPRDFWEEQDKKVNEYWHKVYKQNIEESNEIQK